MTNSALSNPVPPSPPDLWERFINCRLFSWHRSKYEISKVASPVPLFFLRRSVFLSLPRARPPIRKGALWTYLGSDPIIASAATEGLNTGNLFENNRVETAGNGIMMRDTRGSQMIGNTFADTTDASEWDDSDGLVWKVRGKIRKEGRKEGKASKFFWLRCCMFLFSVVHTG